jgi:uncharacterized peroxidase-related enzyme
MAWIRSVPDGREPAEAKPVYDHIRSSSSSGRVSNLFQALGAHPPALDLTYRLYRELLFGASPLSRAQRELVAVVVSATNGCGYCVKHHTDKLAAEYGDAALARQAASDYREADLPAADRALADYAVALTCEPDERTAQDVERLRDYGFGDEAILHATLVAAYYNLVNRIASGLGVELEAEAAPK